MRGGRPVDPDRGVPGAREAPEEEAAAAAVVVVNVGGVRHVLCGELLSRFPRSRLAELLSRGGRGAEAGAAPSLCDDYDAAAGEFYFDRDPDCFRCLMEAYRCGRIHVKRGLCPVCFRDELDFWRIDADALDECCRCLLSEKRDELEEIAGRVRLLLDGRGDGAGRRWGRAQRFVWHLMEEPDSSCPARAVAVLSFLLVLLSSAVMCLSTVPDLQARDGDGAPVEHPALGSIETACIGWFTAEYALRLLSAPNKLRFASAFMNVVDLLAIFPFYLGLGLSAVGASVLELTTVQQATQALRVMRIARVFKLARHSSGLQTLTYALKRSVKELGLLLMYLAIGIFAFSAVGFTVEQSHPETLFKSIPQSFWWAIITMTTVGYGDVYPKTPLGKLNAAVSFLCGIIAIALPIHPIINNFVRYYNKQRVLETAAKHELELMALNAECSGHVGGSVPIAKPDGDTGDTPPTLTGASSHGAHCNARTPLLPEDRLHRDRPQSCE
ncbi:potassium voltage-gated channel subfamily F member 1a [Callorhinchus milii]|nr:potassium voltage-gated channel subfamily F member 1a [Callorhinchus milii]